MERESYGGGNSVRSLSRCGSEMNKMTLRASGTKPVDVACHLAYLGRQCPSDSPG